MRTFQFVYCILRKTEIVDLVVSGSSSQSPVLSDRTIVPNCAILHFAICQLLSTTFVSLVARLARLTPVM
jgi:hypothetical protein